jgi:hypothetical protein
MDSVPGFLTARQYLEGGKMDSAPESIQDLQLDRVLKTDAMTRLYNAHGVECWMMRCESEWV